MRLNGGPLSYKSMRPSQPLSLEEEAVLAFAGCGITGPVWVGKFTHEGAVGCEVSPRQEIRAWFLGRVAVVELLSCEDA
jgi:hypothetical protein